MKIVIAPDKFKGSLTAPEVAHAIEAGFRTVFPRAEYVLVPVADGGDGTMEVLVRATGGSEVRANAVGPDGRPVAAAFGVLPGELGAVVELAQASGLALLPEGSNDPRSATTHGTGQLVAAAIEHGAERIIVAVGGSATSDGGAGALEALGARFMDAAGKDLARGGAALAELQRIDLEPLQERVRGTSIVVATDVDNPLCGPRGAAAVYAPQKGADPETVRMLDSALAHFADVAAATTGEDRRNVAGAGAAGGFGFGFVALAGATIRPGASLVLDIVQLDRRVEGASLVVTGEGKLDAQTHSGKAPAAVADLARKRGVRTAAVCGSVEAAADELERIGIFKAVAATPKGMSLDEALPRAAQLVEEAAAKLAAGLRGSL